MKSVFDRIENIVGKVENSAFPKMFSKAALFGVILTFSAFPKMLFIAALFGVILTKDCVVKA